MNSKLKILIVDDDRNMAHTLADILAISGYEPVEAYSPEEALKVIWNQPLDCVLTDVRMPGMSGVELYEEIRKFDKKLPVLLMTAYAPDDQIREGLKRGAVGLLTKPLAITHLLNFLGLLSMKHNIVIVDDDPTFCETLSEILSRRGFKVAQVGDPNKILEKISSEVHSILLDMKLNGTNGQAVLEQIRSEYDDVPVILVTAYHQEMEDAIAQAMEMNVFTCLYKPLDIPGLLKTLDEILAIRLKKSLLENDMRKEESD